MILLIKIVIAVMLVTPNNPEVQEYFKEQFVLFSKTHYVTLESSKCIVCSWKKRGLSTENFKTNVAFCTKIILKYLHNYFGNHFIQHSNIRSYSSS